MSDILPGQYKLPFKEDISNGNYKKENNVQEKSCKKEVPAEEQKEVHSEAAQRR